GHPFAAGIPDTATACTERWCSTSCSNECSPAVPACRHRSGAGPRDEMRSMVPIKQAVVQRTKQLMAKRVIVTLGIAIAIIATLGFVKFKQIQTAIAEGAAFQPPPEAVTTIVAAEDEWPATLSGIGMMVAVQVVTVSADLPGTVDRILFESGQAVHAGDVLAVLDTRQEQAQLAALEAQRDLARVTFERLQGLLNERVISQAEF